MSIVHCVEVVLDNSQSQCNTTDAYIGTAIATQSWFLQTARGSGVDRALCRGRRRGCRVHNSR